MMKTQPTTNPRRDELKIHKKLKYPGSEIQPWMKQFQKKIEKYKNLESL